MTNRGKKEDVNKKKCEKISFIFEFFISKLGYRKFFMEIWKKIFDSFFKPFLTNRGKMKMNMKKFGKTSSILEVSISNQGHMELFTKIWEKRFFLKFLPEKDILGQRCPSSGPFPLKPRKITKNQTIKS